MPEPWVLGTGSVVFGWLATVSALAGGALLVRGPTIEVRILGCQTASRGNMPDQARRGVRLEGYHLVTEPDGRCLAR